MLTKQQKLLQRRWMTGKLNLIAVARRLGYKKGSMTKGLTKVRSVLGAMGITVL